MKYLLDTCVLIWAALDAAELSNAAKAIKEGMPLLTADGNLIAYGPPVVAV